MNTDKDLIINNLQMKVELLEVKLSKQQKEIDGLINNNKLMANNITVIRKCFDGMMSMLKNHQNQILNLKGRGINKKSVLADMQLHQ